MMGKKRKRYIDTKEVINEYFVTTFIHVSIFLDDAVEISR